MNEHGALSFGKVERKPSVSHALSSKVPQIFMWPGGRLGGCQVTTRARLKCQVGQLDSGLKIFRVKSSLSGDFRSRVKPSRVAATLMDSNRQVAYGIKNYAKYSKVLDSHEVQQTNASTLKEDMNQR